MWPGIYQASLREWFEKKDLQTDYARDLKEYVKRDEVREGLQKIFRAQTYSSAQNYLNANPADTEAQKPFRDAARRYMKGEIQAEQVECDGKRLTGVFRIPAGEGKGLILSTTDSEWFEISENRPVNLFDIRGSSENFGGFVKKHLPLYDKLKYKGRGINYRAYYHRGTGSLIEPMKFVASAKLDADLYETFIDTLEADMDTLVKSDAEIDAEIMLQIVDFIGQVAAIAAVPLTAGTSLAARVVAHTLTGFLVSLGTSIVPSFVQAARADRVEDAREFLVNAIMGLVFEATGPLMPVAATGIKGAVLNKLRDSKLRKIVQPEASSRLMTRPGSGNGPDVAQNVNDRAARKTSPDEGGKSEVTAKAAVDEGAQTGAGKKSGQDADTQDEAGKSRGPEEKARTQTEELTKADETRAHGDEYAFPFIDAAETPSRQAIRDATHIVDNTRGLSELLRRPKEACYEITTRLRGEFNSKNYDTEIRAIFLWNEKSPMPANHFVLLAKKNGETVIVDATAGQFGGKDMISSGECQWVREFTNLESNRNRLISWKDFKKNGDATMQYGSWVVEADMFDPKYPKQHQPQWFRSKRRQKVIDDIPRRQKEAHRDEVPSMTEMVSHPGVVLKPQNRAAITQAVADRFASETVSPRDVAPGRTDAKAPRIFLFGTDLRGLQIKKDEGDRIGLAAFGNSDYTKGRSVLAYHVSRTDKAILQAERSANWLPEEEEKRRAGMQKERQSGRGSADVNRKIRTSIGLLGLYRQGEAFRTDIRVPMILGLTSGEARASGSTGGYYIPRFVSTSDVKFVITDARFVDSVRDFLKTFDGGEHIKVAGMTA